MLNPIRHGDPNQAVWGRVKERLRADLGDDVYGSWFAKMDLESIDGNTAKLSVPTRFLKSWVMSHYAERVLACCQAHDTNVARIELSVRSCVHHSVVSHSVAKVDANPVAEKSAHAHFGGVCVDVEPTELKSDALNERFTGDTLLVGRHNTLAHAAVMLAAKRARDESPCHNPIYIHAGVGQGKTHLLQALAHAVKACGQHTVVYTSADKLMQLITSSVRGRSAPLFLAALKAVDVLVIDDLQFVQGHLVQDVLCRALESMVALGHQVVVASDRAPSQMLGFEPRVQALFGGGLVLEMSPLEEHVRYEILRSRVLAQCEKHPLSAPSPMVLTYVSKVAAHGRDIDMAVDRLWVHYLEHRSPMLYDEALAEFGDLARKQAKLLKVEDIQRVVARYYNVSREMILSSRRTAMVVKPRQVAMYLCKTLTKRSLPEIGRRFGGRDHTTVLHAVRKIEWMSGERGGGLPSSLKHFDPHTPVDYDLVRELRDIKRLLVVADSPPVQADIPAAGMGQEEQLVAAE